MRKLDDIIEDLAGWTAGPTAKSDKEAEERVFRYNMIQEYLKEFAEAILAEVKGHGQAD